MKKAPTPAVAVAAALARIARYPRPLSPEDAAEVRREMVEFLLGGPVAPLPGVAAAFAGKPPDYAISAASHPDVLRSILLDVADQLEAEDTPVRH